MADNHGAFAQVAIDQFMHDHVVTVVKSIENAKNSLINNNYDLIFVDCDLDEGKGNDLVSHVKVKYPTIRIIAISSNDQGNDAMLKAGADVVCSIMEFNKIGSALYKYYNI